MKTSSDAFPKKKTLKKLNNKRLDDNKSSLPPLNPPSKKKLLPIKETPKNKKLATSKEIKDLLQKSSSSNNVDKYEVYLSLKDWSSVLPDAFLTRRSGTRVMSRCRKADKFEIQPLKDISSVGSLIKETLHGMKNSGRNESRYKIKRGKMRDDESENFSEKKKKKKKNKDGDSSIDHFPMEREGMLPKISGRKAL